jgi:hypothetical protein
MNDSEKRLLSSEVVGLVESVGQLRIAMRAQQASIEEILSWLRNAERRLARLEQAGRPRELEF